MPGPARIDLNTLGIFSSIMYHFIVWHLLQPLSFFMILMGLFLARLWWKRRESKGRLLPLTLAYVALFLACSPAVTYWVLGSMEWQYPPLLQRPPDAQAIVVLSSGAFPPDGPRLTAEQDRTGMLRCLAAADLYFQGTACPIVVSGGVVPDSDPPLILAQVMKDFLVRLGIPASDILVEGTSSDTFENAVESCQRLKEREVRKLVLVTDAVHLVRSVACFRKQGLEVVPCGCMYEATPSSEARYHPLPDSGAARNSYRVVHEWIGLLWYKLRGKI